jgi:hypothetical protein
MTTLDLPLVHGRFGAKSESGRELLPKPLARLNFIIIDDAAQFV